MISVVFVIGVLNLILGFILAVRLERQITVPLPVWQASEVTRDVILELSVPEPLPIDELRDTLPKRWLDLLNDGEVEFSSFVEAATEVLRLEVDGYRRDLLDVEDLVRSTIEKNKPEALKDTIGVLVALNEEWMDRQKDALEVMSRRQDQLGDFASIGQDLESILLDQTALLQQACEGLVRIRESGTADEVSAAVVHSLSKMTELVHELRDQNRRASLMIMCREGRLHLSDRDMQRDDVTGLQNRIALELVFRNWWKEDVDRHRQVSAALIDVDRCGELNSAFTTRVGDRILKNLAIYLEQLCDSESGLERVYHYAGQQFVIFFGDMGPRTAVSKVEKIRQTVEATKFEYGGKAYRLTLRAGVTFAKPDDDTSSLFERLEELAETARHEGRNRTALEEASGSGVVQPEEMEVKKRVIRVE